jgi:hypothetical protein
LSLVSFTPWGSLDDYLDVLDFIEQRDLIYNVDPVQYGIRLLVPPGSRLLATPQMAPHIAGLHQDHFSYAWTHPDPRMDALHLEVCKLVEAAVRADEDPFVTFCRVKHLALAAQAGRPFSATSHLAGRTGDRPPRLTESWFC